MLRGWGNRLDSYCKCESIPLNERERQKPLNVKLPLGNEEFVLVQIPVLPIDCVVKRDDDHLRYLISIEISRNERSVNATETVGQCAVGVVATGGRIRVVIRIWLGLGEKTMAI